MENFEEYLRQGEPNKAEKAKVWKTAIGLQQVDGLKPSDYLIATARQNIEGDITIEVNTQNDPVKDANDPVSDPVKRKILNCLKQNPKAKYIELATETGYSPSTIKRHIQELKKLGFLERIGSDKTGHWKINN